MLFSVVIPTFNRADILKRAIGSVLGQTWTDWELIVVDDASTDATPAVLAAYRDSRIRVLRNETNQERSVSRNRGIDAARGDYVCFLDSDDLYRPDHLETLASAIGAAPEKTAFFFTQFVRNEGNRHDAIVYPPVTGSQVEYVIRNQIATPTACIHRCLLQKDRFEPSLKINEDVELFTRLVARAPLVRVEEATVETFIHGGNTMSVTPDYITPQMKAMRRIFGNRLTKPLISPEFKRSVLVNLHHQLVPFTWRQKGKWAAFWVILSFLLKYPHEPLNGAKVILLLGATPLAWVFPKLRRASAVIVDNYY